MRRPVFYACWKSNKTPKEVLEFYKAVETRGMPVPKGTEVILAPSPVFLELSHARLPQTLKLGAQDVSDLPSGGRMGEVTAKLLKEYGVKYCAVGHREKRERGDTDAVVNKKITNLQNVGIVPMLCVGENWQENEAGLTRDVIKKQLQGGLAGIPNAGDILVCYRPSWTLEKGIVPRGDFVNMIASYIREIAVEMKDDPMAGSFPILYGGDVTPANVKEYMTQPDIDGIFFVRSALSVDDFYGVISGGSN